MNAKVQANYQRLLEPDQLNATYAMVEALSRASASNVLVAAS